MRFSWLVSVFICFSSIGSEAMSQTMVQTLAPSEIRYNEIRALEYAEFRKPVQERNFQPIIDAYVGLFKETRHSSSAYRLYELGIRANQREKALIWLKAAAESGMPKAQLEYGEHLMLDRKTCKRGYAWIQTASNHYDVAKERLTALDPKKPCKKKK